MLNVLITFITYVSYYLILNLAFRIGYFIFKRIRPRKNHSEKYGVGTWALVTGGSDGIGKAICEQLAKQGFNIIVVARNIDKLKNFTEELKAEYQILAEYLSVDFNSIEQTYENYQNLFEHYFTSREISILVNNVGTVQPGYILKMTEQECIKTINMNCYPQAFLSKLYIKHKKEKGAIINLSSLSAETIVVTHNLYGATKQWNDYLSKGLSLEYPNLDIISVRPGGVETALSQIKNNFVVGTSTENCAKAILDHLGWEIETHGFWFHEVTSWMISLLNERIVAKISGKILSNILKDRQRYD